MVGRTFSGTYTKNSFILYLTKYTCQILLLLSIFLMLIFGLTNDKTIITINVRCLEALTIDILAYLIMRRAIKLKPIECKIVIDSIEEGKVAATVKLVDMQELQVNAKSCEWNRKKSIMTIIDESEDAIKLSLNKNDCELLKHEGIKFEHRNKLIRWLMLV